jgi:septum formation protein
MGDNTGLVGHFRSRHFPMSLFVPTPRLALASASPRRRELLLQLGLAHVLLPQDIDESQRSGEVPAAYVRRLAQEKARSGLRDPACPPELPVLAADTSVVCDGRILGKPASLEHALGMLELLSGREHQVLTAVAVAQGSRLHEALSVSSVRFRAVERAELVAYWNSGEPCDKAGAYAVQGLGAMFISHIDGSYSGVMGLPLFETVQLLADFGITGTMLLAEFRKESRT